MKRLKSNKELIRELMGKLPSGWVDMSSSKERKPKIAWNSSEKTYIVSITRDTYRGKIQINYNYEVKDGKLIKDQFVTSSLELMIDFIKEVVN